MGYNFDLAKMPGDLKSLFYQVAVKEGNRSEIDTEFEYSLFMSRVKNLMDTGRASYSKDVFDDIFSVKIYQNKITPTEKEAMRIPKLLSDGAQNIELEKIDKNLYRYTITYGDLEKLDYTQRIGTVKIGDNNCLSDGKTYTFYKNGSMEINDNESGNSILYNENDNCVE